MYAMYDSYGSRRLRRERNFYQGGWATVKIKERGSGGGVLFTTLHVSVMSCILKSAIKQFDHNRECVLSFRFVALGSVI